MLIQGQAISRTNADSVPSHHYNQCWFRAKPSAEPMLIHCQSFTHVQQWVGNSRHASRNGSCTHFAAATPKLCDSMLTTRDTAVLREGVESAVYHFAAAPPSPDGTSCLGVQFWRGHVKLGVVGWILLLSLLHDHTSRVSCQKGPICHA